MLLLVLVCTCSYIISLGLKRRQIYQFNKRQRRPSLPSIFTQGLSNGKQRFPSSSLSPLILSIEEKKAPLPIIQSTTLLLLSSRGGRRRVLTNQHQTLCIILKTTI